ncbi:MAG: hypothetical protein PHP23_09295, partial [Desulfobacterales bacterium]|nr:hypothetical protein [Desulfobacterales bacterium]
MKLFKKKRKRMLTKSFRPEGIRFACTEEPVPAFPLNSNSSEILSKLLFQGDLWSALDSLWVEGLLEPSDKGAWIVPYTIYDQLNSDEDSDLFHVLAIPFAKSLEMQVDSSSHVGDRDFRISVEANHPDYGPLREEDPYRNGRVFVIDDQHIAALTLEQARVFDLAQGNDVNWDSLEDRMGYLAAVKDAAEKANAGIDKYLASEEYAFRSDAKLDMRVDSPEEITLIPEVEGMKSYGIGSGEDLLTGDIKPVITKAESGYQRKRLVLDKDLCSRLSELPKGGKIKGTGVPKLLTNPEQIIPEGFDLSLFSERVKGIKTKVYNSRPYIHVNKTTG